MEDEHIVEEKRALFTRVQVKNGSDKPSTFWQISMVWWQYLIALFTVLALMLGGVIKAHGIGTEFVYRCIDQRAGAIIEEQTIKRNQAITAAIEAHHVRASAEYSAKLEPRLHALERDVAVITVQLDELLRLSRGRTP